MHAYIYKYGICGFKSLKEKEKREFYEIEDIESEVKQASTYRMLDMKYM